MRITALGALVALLVVGAAAAAGGAALALGQSPVPDEAVIHACRHPNGGWVRIVSEGAACRRRERAVSWNVQGPKGEPGPAGPAGPKGDPGTGLGRLDDLDGIPCTPDGGGDGSVELDQAGDDTVLFRCVAGEDPPPPGKSSSSSTRSTTTRSGQTATASSRSRTLATPQPTSPAPLSSSWTAPTRASIAARS
jgi:hypothetical protein